ELGVPFSDPTADGVAIQRASARALRQGATLRGVLDVARRVRTKSDVPLLLFGYYNPILRFGESKLVQAAAEAGVDGMLVVDLPPEECGSLRTALVERGLDYVPLVAPTTTAMRVEVVSEVATHFLYYVSMTGVTGARAADLADAAVRAADLETRTGRPVAVGFGVTTPEDVRTVAARASGVVVGSAVVRQIEDADNVPDALDRVKTLVAALRAATGKGRA
ncbi:MAG: tryptophan synthase subunit alpha, partial [Myxococcales bacterium]|nr:tryptophan synthase subunit alpha [Myxococcales bacterium]